MLPTAAAAPIKPPGYDVKLIAYSISRHGHGLVTFTVKLPRIMLPEVNVHNSASKNSASSRARPVSKVIASVEEQPFFPIRIGANQPGMQAENELDPASVKKFMDLWDLACRNAILVAKALDELGVHKQLANRVIEPYSFTEICLTMSTPMLDNFLGLRTDDAAQFEIKVAADLMKYEFERATPVLLQDDEWHLPFVHDEDRELAAVQYPDDPLALVKVSAGRCARISYLTHEGHRDLAADITLHDRLLDGGHLSPTQHMARPFDDDEMEDTRLMQSLLRERMTNRGANAALMDARLRQLEYVGNLQGFVQYRKLIPNEHNFSLALKTRGEKGW